MTEDAMLNPLSMSPRRACVLAQLIFQPEALGRPPCNYIFAAITGPEKIRRHRLLNRWRRLTKNAQDAAIDAMPLA